MRALSQLKANGGQHGNPVHIVSEFCRAGAEVIKLFAYAEGDTCGGSGLDLIDACKAERRARRRHIAAVTQIGNQPLCLKQPPGAGLSIGRGGGQGNADGLIGLRRHLLHSNARVLLGVT